MIVNMINIAMKNKSNLFVLEINSNMFRLINKLLLLLNSWICAVCFYQLKKIDIFFNVKPINSRFSIDKFFKSHQLLRIPTPKLLLSFVHRQQLQNVSRIFDYSFLKIISCEKNSFFLFFSFFFSHFIIMTMAIAICFYCPMKKKQQQQQTN